MSQYGVSWFSIVSWKMVLKSTEPEREMHMLVVIRFPFVVKTRPFGIRSIRIP